MKKWIKVYRGPGYPVDPWKDERRVLEEFSCVMVKEPVPSWIRGANLDDCYSEEYLEAMARLPHYPVIQLDGIDEAAIKQDLMDATQARARQWIAKFIEQPELSLEKKKERREAEQYMESDVDVTQTIYPPGMQT